MTRQVVVAAMLLGATTAGAADEFPALTLKRGTDVRLMVEDGPMRMVAGRLLASDADSLTVETAGGTERVTRDRLFHVQYRMSARDRKKGAAIGATATGLVGVALGILLLVSESDGNGCSGCVLVPGLFGAVAAIPGGALGYAIGARGNDWRESKGRGLTVVGAGPTRGVRVSLRLRVP